jgi:hypothetical protein
MPGTAPPPHHTPLTESDAMGQPCHRTTPLTESSLCPVLLQRRDCAAEAQNQASSAVCRGGRTQGMFHANNRITSVCTAVHISAATCCTTLPGSDSLSLSFQLSCTCLQLLQLPACQPPQACLVTVHPPPPFMSLLLLPVHQARWCPSSQSLPSSLKTTSHSASAAA